VVIGLTSGGADDTQRASLAALIAIEGAIFVVVAALVRISTRRHLPNRGEGLLRGAAASALWGVSDIAIKYLTHAAPARDRRRSRVASSAQAQRRGLNV
jgi:hypothetical protein